MALDLNLYKSRLNTYGDCIEVTKKKIKNEFAKTPSYVTAYVNSSDTLREFHISDENLNNTDPTRKRATPIPDENIDIGDYLNINNNYWLTTSISDKTNPIYHIAQIRKCNLLPFYYKIDDIVFTTYGYYEKNIYINNDNEPITLPNDVVVVTIPRNNDTLKISRDDKFYIFEDSWYEFYQIEGVDRSKVDDDKGLVIVRAKEIPVEGTPEEYYSLSPTPSTNIGEVIITPKSLYPTLGDTPQLTCKVYDKNGILLPDEPVAWSSSSESIATVNQDGLVTTLKVGKCDIKATSNTDNAIFGICDLNVCSGGWF